jgi:4-hydroxy-2-oxoheptanedioate aldolase
MSKLGTFSVIDGVVIPEILSDYCDFIILDSEHGLEGLSHQRSRIHALGGNVECFIRVPCLSRIEIQRYLEIKPDGLMVPQISSINDAASAVEFYFYPPIGSRGVSPYTRQFGYESTNIYEKKAEHNIKSKLCLLIEGKGGIECLSEMLHQYSDYIYMIYFGLFDFANIMQTDPSLSNKVITDGIEDIVSKCREHSVKVGTIARQIDDIATLREIGVDYIVYKNDTEIFIDGLNNALA